MENLVLHFDLSTRLWSWFYGDKYGRRVKGGGGPFTSSNEAVIDYFAKTFS